MDNNNNNNNQVKGPKITNMDYHSSFTKKNNNSNPSSSSVQHKRVPSFQSNNVGSNSNTTSPPLEFYSSSTRQQEAVVVSPNMTPRAYPPMNNKLMINTNPASNADTTLPHQQHLALNGTGGAFQNFEHKRKNSSNIYHQQDYHNQTVFHNQQQQYHQLVHSSSFNNNNTSTSFSYRRQMNDNQNIQNGMNNNTNSNSPLNPSIGISNQGMPNLSPVTNSTYQAPTSLNPVYHEVFLKFVKLSEIKVVYLMFNRLNEEADLASPLKLGYDPAYDTLLKNLGALAKHAPKILVDSIMVWRKSKSDHLYEIPPSLHKPEYGDLKAFDSILKERKSLVSNFILCRILTEVVLNLEKDELSDELGEKLEEMVFGQFKNADPEIILKNPNRKANLDFFAQFIGALSQVRFDSVTDRFLSELSKANSSRESKMELMIRSMRYIRIKIYPMDALEASSEFLQICAEHFQNMHGSLPSAFSELFYYLIEPLVVVATAEINLPSWAKTIELIYPKAMKMAGKSKNPTLLFHLIVDLLSVSKREFFKQNLPSFMDIVYARLKERSNRPLLSSNNQQDSVSTLMSLSSSTSTSLSSASGVSSNPVASSLVGFLRLVWVHLFRHPEQDEDIATKRMYALVHLLLLSNKKSLFLRDMNDQEDIVFILYWMMVKHTDFTMEILLPSILCQESTPLTFNYNSNSCLAQIFDENPHTLNAFGSAMGQAFADQFDGNLLTSLAPMYPERLSIVLKALFLYLNDVLEYVKPSSSTASNWMSSAADNMFAFPSSFNGIVVEQKMNLPDPPCPIDITLEAKSIYQYNLPNNSRYSNSYDDSMSDSIYIKKNGKNDFNSHLTKRDRQKVSMECIKPDVFKVIGSSTRSFIGKLNSVIGSVLVTFDVIHGSHLLQASTVKSGYPDSNNSTLSNFDFHSNQSTMSLLNVKLSDLKIYDLLSIIISSFPLITPEDMTMQQATELICKYCIHGFPQVRKAACDSVLNLSSIEQIGYWKLEQKNCHMLLHFLNVLPNMISHWSSELYLKMLPVPGRVENLPMAYLDSVETLINLASRLVEHANDPKIDKSILKEIIHTLETFGLLELCSGYPKLRSKAIKIVQLASELDSGYKGFDINAMKKRDSSIMSSLSHGTSSNHGAPEAQFFYLDEGMELNKTRLWIILRDLGKEILTQNKKTHPAFKTKLNARNNRASTVPQSRQAIQNIELNILDIAQSQDSNDKLLWKISFTDLLKAIFDYASPTIIEMGIRIATRRLASLTSIVSTMDRAASRSGAGGGSSGASSSSSINNTGFFDDKFVVEQFGFLSCFSCAFIDISFALTNNCFGKEAKLNAKKIYRHIMPPFDCDTQSQQRGTPSLNSFILSKGVVLKNSSNLFNMLMIPALNHSDAALRQEAIRALTCIHWISFSRLLESLKPCFKQVVDDMRAKITLGRMEVAMRESKKGFGTGNGSTMALAVALQNSKKSDQLRLAILELLSLVIHFNSIDLFHEPSVHKFLIQFIRETTRFITDQSFETDPEYYEITTFFSRFIGQFHLACIEANNSAAQKTGILSDNRDHRQMKMESMNTAQFLFELPFDMRFHLFQIFSRRCGVGEYTRRSKEYFQRTLQAIFDASGEEQRVDANTAKKLDMNRRTLEFESIKVMSILCKGPLSSLNDNRSNMHSASPRMQEMQSLPSFDMNQLLTWIHSLFDSKDKNIHEIGIQALVSLMEYNPNDHELVAKTVLKCYSEFSGQNLSVASAYLNNSDFNFSLGYFKALVDLFGKKTFQTKPISLFYAVFCLALFKSGDGDKAARILAVQLIDRLAPMYLMKMAKDESSSSFSKPQNTLKQKRITIYSVYQDLVDDGLEKQSSENPENIISEETFNLLATHRAALTSELPIVYKYTQAEISSKLANAYPNASFMVLNEYFKILHVILDKHNIHEQSDFLQSSHSSKMFATIRDLLVCMTPWLRQVSLHDMARETIFLPENHLQIEQHSKASIPLDEPCSLGFILINNLVSLTLRLSDVFLTELENLWVQLIEHFDDHAEQDELFSFWNYQNTINLIVDFISAAALVRKNPQFLFYAKRIMVYLIRSNGNNTLIQTLASMIIPGDSVPTTNLNAHSFGNWSHVRDLKPLEEQVVDSNAVFVGDINEVVPEIPIRPSFSKSQLALVMLTELLLEMPYEYFIDHFAILFHVSVIHIDHFITLVSDHARLLLRHLVRIIPKTAPEITNQANQLLEMLQVKDNNERIWLYEDISPDKTVLKSTNIIQVIVEELVPLVTTVDPDIVSKWGQVALSWGTQCPVRHLACRSLQVFRILTPTLDQWMVIELLKRLSSTITEKPEEIQGFTLEILFTLNYALQNLEDHQLPMYPQLFWTALACIHSPIDHEIYQGVQLLTSFLPRFNLRHNHELLLKSKPKRWLPQKPFDGVLRILAKVAILPECEKSILQIMESLITIPPKTKISTHLEDSSDDEDMDVLVDLEDRKLLSLILFSLPSFIASFDDNSSDIINLQAQASVDKSKIGKFLSKESDVRGFKELSMIMDSIVHKKFRAKDDFLMQISRTLHLCFFPRYIAYAITILGHLLVNNRYRIAVLEFLKIMISMVSFDESYSSLKEVIETTLAPLLIYLSVHEKCNLSLSVLNEIQKLWMRSMGDVNMRIVFGNKSIYKILKENDTLGLIDDICSCRIEDNITKINAMTMMDILCVDDNMACQLVRSNVASIATDIMNKHPENSFQQRYHNNGNNLGLVANPPPRISSNKNTVWSRMFKDDYEFNEEDELGKGEINVVDTYGQQKQAKQQVKEQLQQTRSVFEEKRSSGNNDKSHRQSHYQYRNQNINGGDPRLYPSENMVVEKDRTLYELECIDLFDSSVMKTLDELDAYFEEKVMGSNVDDHELREVSTFRTDKSLLPDLDTLLNYPDTVVLFSCRMRKRLSDLQNDKDFTSWFCADLCNALQETDDNILKIVECQPCPFNPKSLSIIDICIACEHTHDSLDLALELKQNFSVLSKRLSPSNNDNYEAEVTLGASLLSQGIMSSKLDFGWDPEIKLEYQGIRVPYTSLKTNQKTSINGHQRGASISSGRRRSSEDGNMSMFSSFKHNTKILNSNDTYSDLEINLNMQKIIMAALKSHSTGKVNWDIFNQCLDIYHLVVLDWQQFMLACRDQMNFEMRKIVDHVQSLHATDYIAPLQNQKISMDEVEQRFIVYSENDPKYTTTFHKKRDHHIQTIHRKLLWYLSTRKPFGLSPSGKTFTQNQLMDLTIYLVQIYISVLELQKLVEEFLDIPKDKELVVAEKCLQMLNGTCMKWVSQDLKDLRNHD